MFAPVKIRAVFLLLVLAISTPAVSELVKISNLLSHFQKHNSREHLDFIDFLMAHYAHEDGDDDDAAEDRELPFLSGNPGGLTPCSIPREHLLVDCFYYLPPIHMQVPGKYYLPDPHLSMIWQPPRHS